MQITYPVKLELRYKDWKKIKKICKTYDIEIWMYDLKPLPKGVWMALEGLMGSCFGAGWGGGSHGVKNNASQATKNSLYAINIIK